ncbi:MAG: sigma-70 family RNA polymerase sigma factor [Pseudomonadota bacterium]
MTELSDKRVLEKVAQGDKSAMRILYDRHAPGLRRFVENWIANKNDAADVVHETMLDVWRSAGRFEGRSAVKSWMYSIARNKAVDRNRRGARTVLDEPDVETPDDAPNPEEVMQSFQDAARVRACVEKLSGPHKTAIQLAFFEDLSYKEVAEIENCPVGTIKTRIMHAKKLLMHCLSQEA